MPSQTAPQSQTLCRELVHAREQTDRLFGLISQEALYSRPISERHRLIFYLGHFDAFDWNLLARRGMSAPSFHPEFDKLFERGIDPPPGQAPADSPRDWPAQAEVEEYGDKTRAWIDSHVDDLDPWLLQMAIEHRHMHAETLAYLLHGLPYEQKRFAAPAVSSRRPAPTNTMLKVPAGITTLGKTTETFGWDNEHLARTVSVPAFRISKFKISNGEYLEFVRAGGPAPHYWTSRSATGRSATSGSTTSKHDNWFYRGMFSLMPLPLDWPVWVTWQQAAAYAQWRKCSLPSEPQFQLAAALITPEPARDNFDYRRWDPVAVDTGSENSRVPLQMTGNGWEWTSDLFAPFEGFQVHPFYPGYSADFFDGQHYVMKGASPRTAALLTRPSFRNWFRPDYPYMYAGFRLAENDN